MRTKSWGVTSCLALACFIAAEVPAQSQTRDRGRRVTDPNELAHYGFGPDTILFIAPGAEVIQGPGGMSAEERAARAVIRPRDAGPTGEAKPRRVEYVTYNGAQLRAADTSVHGFAPQLLGYFPTEFGHPPHYIQVQLPGRVRLQGFRWWALNQKVSGDQESLPMRFYEHCLPANGAGEPVITLLAEAGTDFGLGQQSGYVNFSPDVTVDDAQCSYTFEAVYEGFFAPGDIILERIRAQYLPK